MSILGTRVVRREDPALLRGSGQYLDDLRGDGLDTALRATFVRSPLAHARIESIDVDEAREAPGVIAVFTAADLDLTPPAPRMPWVPGPMARPWLATDTVRFVGEPVAVVLTETESQGEDAAELVIIDYEPLAVVVDLESALEPGAPLLFPEVGTNLACEFLGEPDDELFEGCEVVVSGRMVNQRLAACPLESRATAARWLDGRLTVWTSTQGAHGVRGAVAGALGLDAGAVRVITPDVGGGFGAKISPYPEDLVVVWAARHLDRPVTWIEDRNENMLAMGHGRDHVHHFTIGGDRDGRVVAYRLVVLANAGAYPAMAAFLPTFTRMMAPGTYDIERVESHARVVVTNTMSIEAYRGAGRPEATATIERAMDMFAAEIDLDPVEVRRRNLIAVDAFPFTTSAGAVYDAGDYQGALDKVLAAADYAELRAEQRRRRATGDHRLVGIGVSTYVEITAGGGAPQEYGSVRIEPDGSATVLTGASPHGQGLDTALASIVGDRLGMDPDRIRVLHGDTDVVPRGSGTMGSRSLQTGGSAVYVAADQVVAAAKDLAASELEADPADIVLDGGRFHVAGTPAIFRTWEDLAAQHSEELSVETDFRADGPTFPFGAHVAVVEVDRDTGQVRLDRLIACDDAGTIVNPLLADGQRQGGIAQGVAQALFEEFRYDDDGNPMTANFSDYGIVSAAELPDFELVGQETPTPNNPLGAKGIGESGTIGSTPAVQSAVVDALAHLGVRHVDLPATPARVWEAIRDAGQPT